MLAPRTRLAACAAALVLAIAPGFASADIPTGSFEFELGGVNSLWMGGDEDTHEDADGFCASFGSRFDVVEFCDYGLYVDGKGKISGHASFIGWREDTRIAIEGPIKGAQRGDNRSGVTRASFVIRLAGTASRGDVTLDMRVSRKLDAQIDAAGLMTGAWTQKTCIEGSACETFRFPADPQVWSNGHWTLELDVELITFGGGGQFGRRSFTAGGLAGGARIRFGDETFCDFAVSGQHDLKQDAADLTLTPTSAKCEGGSLRLRSLVKGGGALADAYLAQLQYKLFGVAGTTVVDTQVASDYRVLLEHYYDPINQPLPPFGRPDSGGSGAMATITVQLMSGAPPQFTASSTANSASISMSAMGVLADSGDRFETLQSAARYELTGFEARPVGPERPVLDVTQADPLTQY